MNVLNSRSRTRIWKKNVKNLPNSMFDLRIFEIVFFAHNSCVQLNNKTPRSSCCNLAIYNNKMCRYLPRSSVANQYSKLFMLTLNVPLLCLYLSLYSWGICHMFFEHWMKWMTYLCACLSLCVCSSAYADRQTDIQIFNDTESKLHVYWCGLFPMGFLIWNSICVWRLWRHV